MSGLSHFISTPNKNINQYENQDLVIYPGEIEDDSPSPLVYDSNYHQDIGSIHSDFTKHHSHHVIEDSPAQNFTPKLPPEARVKKYSYFYIGRKLWYIPLYFTVWFSFYVLWLILKSIARHKVIEYYLIDSRLFSPLSLLYSITYSCNILL